MCGIIGIAGFKAGTDSDDQAKELVLKGLEIMKNRGPDNTRIAAIGTKEVEGYFGHNLLSIVGHVPQPIPGKKGIIISNCEIYNWKELNSKYKLNAKNDSDLLLQLLQEKGTSCLEELDGVYAFAYFEGEEIILARDLIGVKPLHHYTQPISGEELKFELFFASEKKALPKESIELNPRQILKYNIKTKKIIFENREFFKLRKEELNEERVKKLLINSVKKRLPPKEDKVNVGILFSGGIDSTVIAKIVTDLGYDVTCYSAGFQDERTKDPEDLVVARQVANDMNLKYKEKILNLEEVEKELKKIIPIIEEADVVKAGVALPFSVCCNMAKQDGVRVIFSGLGSEEIFAGYQRHKETTKTINEECMTGLKAMHERDLYRDDVITMNYGIELRLPFLDKELVEYALSIPGEDKIVNGVEKAILRKISKELGVVSYVCDRKKRAAQYGSRFDSAMKKLAHKNGFETRKKYISQFL
ncbi:asparagine synthetase B [Candidatus Woesearchaeota archaeon]|nr:asparagine synthetase B [Candidatus Woesearchaeota archaeon]